jgi:SsrA-binding protein
MAKQNVNFSKHVNIKNRKARFEYEFVAKFVAGIVLTGTEIKSIRESKASLQHAYCIIRGKEVFVRDLHISPYSQATHYNHDPVRERKLLLNRQEIKKLNTHSKEKGLTIIPTRLFINNRGLAKLEIALAKGKKTHDKRHDIKERDQKRELDRMRL